MTLPHKILLGRYELRSMLGKGGMGEVYLSQDMSLHRPVAIKLLAPEYASDHERLRRFEQEAYAASSLNHHGIVTIYEIGRVVSVPFIVMEYVEGQTLRQRIKQTRLTVADALAIVMQVAEALAAAHKAGIVHRDIKPENIMLRKDNYVKVLDFGLAKLGNERLQAGATPEASTMTHINTGQGAVLGTAVYMSPEQLRGQEIDGRTDLWSLGVVLYEMLNYALPFTGHTTGEVIVSILEREPQPLVEKWPDVPEELQGIITKALQKNRNERYQTAEELLTALRQFGRQLESTSVTESAGVRMDSGRLQSHAARTGGAISAKPVSTVEQNASTAERSAQLSAQPLASGRWTHTWRKYLLVALLLSLIGIATYGGYRLFPGRMVSTSVRSLKFQRLTLPGNVKDAIISPDGKYIASIMDEDGKQSLYVMELATSTRIKVAEPSEKGYAGMTFSPDGVFIYYLENEAETATLYRVSKLGGGHRRLSANVNTAVTFSPDGTHMAFARYDMTEQSSALIIANADGSDEKRLVVRRMPEYFPLSPNQAGPAWSPDGQVLACVTVNSAGGTAQMNIDAINVKDGSARRISAKPWVGIARTLWLADGSGLVVAGSESLMEPWQLSLLSYPSGEVRRMTHESNHYDKVSMTSDSTTLLAVMTDVMANFWLVNVGDVNQARALGANYNDGVWGVAWMPNGQLIYSSKSEDESLNIWVKEAGGAGQKQLTFESGVNYQPAVSADGRYIVFVSSRAGRLNIWRMNADGTQSVRLTEGDYEDMPQVTPDGRWVLYHSNKGVWKVPIEGGAPVLLTNKNAQHPVVSPDGKTLACFVLNPGANAAWKLELFSLDNMSQMKQFELPPSVYPMGGLRWTSDGHGLTYVRGVNNAYNIWLQPLDNEPPRQLTDFTDAQLFSFAWSSDGKHLLCVRGLKSLKAVLIKDFF